MGNRDSYASCPVLRSFIDGILYVVNTFNRVAVMTPVLRDEDVSFPPTTDQYSNSSHPVLKDRSLGDILNALKECADSSDASDEGRFRPYLEWIRSMVIVTAWSMDQDPSAQQTLQALVSPAGAAATNATPASKNKRKKGGNKNRAGANAAAASSQQADQTVELVAKGIM